MRVFCAMPRTQLMATIGYGLKTLKVWRTLSRLLELVNRASATAVVKLATGKLHSVWYLPSTLFNRSVFSSFTPKLKRSPKVSQRGSCEPLERRFYWKIIVAVAEFVFCTYNWQSHNFGKHDIVLTAVLHIIFLKLRSLLPLSDSVWLLYRLVKWQRVMIPKFGDAYSTVLILLRN